MQIFMVGGAVRDELLGQKSKDLDYTVVVSPEECFNGHSWETYDPFRVMVNKLKSDGYKIFLETPEYFTVRAQTPDKRETADFVLARKEDKYTDGRRPDKVEVGTLLDDLGRRDFGMNAIAKAADGSLIDPFNGREDITQRIIRAVGDPVERLTEDALRAVRAFRFAVTKGFLIQRDLSKAMESDEVLNAIETKISDERIQQELSKAFRFDTGLAGSVLFYGYPDLAEACFAGSVSLDATMKTKGFNKPKPDNKRKNLPEARNGCTCSCHTSGGMHISKCC
jgi:tRNA nucleotidyltransferase (CCA-adding enzyme)